MDQNRVRSTKKTLHQKSRKLTIDSEFSADFLFEELSTALLTNKPGKAAGWRLSAGSLKALEKGLKNGLSRFSTIF
jgi:hypothetical protein